jgi:hypothetical protein
MAVVAIDVALPLCVKIAKHRSEFSGIDSGIDVGDDPAAESPRAVGPFVAQLSKHPATSLASYRPSEMPTIYKLILWNIALSVIITRQGGKGSEESQKSYSAKVAPVF